MDYENFKEQFVEDIKEKLYEQGTEVDKAVKAISEGFINQPQIDVA